MITQPFSPKYGSTRSLTPAAGSAQIVLDADKQSRQVRIANTGANVAYVRISADAAPVATSADYPVLPNSITVISKDPQHDRIAHISAAGTTLLVTLGEGF